MIGRWRAITVAVVIAVAGTGCGIRERATANETVDHTPTSAAAEPATTGEGAAATQAGSDDGPTTTGDAAPLTAAEIEELERSLDEIDRILTDIEGEFDQDAG